jgi:hypothetical protein
MYIGTVIAVAFERQAHSRSHAGTHLRDHGVIGWRKYTCIAVAEKKVASNTGWQELHATDSMQIG